MDKKSWFKKIISNILLGISGMLFGALFMITGLFILTIEVLFQGIGKIISHLI